MKPLLVLAVLLGVAPLAPAGLVFDTETVRESASPSADTFESKFRFKVEGDQPVTITEVQTSCGCLSASADKKTYAPGESGTISAVIKLGSFEGEVKKAIYVLSDDATARRRQLQMLITIPKLLEISPEVTTWTVGEEPKAKTVRIKVLRDQPIDVTGVTSTRETVTAELKEIEKGRLYEVVLTPSTTAQPTLGALRIETTCEIARYKSRLSFFNVIRPRTPSGTVKPPGPGPAAEAPSVGPTPPVAK